MFSHMESKKKKKLIEVVSEVEQKLKGPDDRSSVGEITEKGHKISDAKILDRFTNCN